MRNPNAIKRLAVYSVKLPFSGFGSRWIGRETPEHYDSTLVEPLAEVLGEPVAVYPSA